MSRQKYISQPKTTKQHPRRANDEHSGVTNQKTQAVQSSVRRSDRLRLAAAQATTQLKARGEDDTQQAKSSVQLGYPLQQLERASPQFSAPLDSRKRKIIENSAAGRRAESRWTIPGADEAQITIPKPSSKSESVAHWAETMTWSKEYLKGSGPMAAPQPIRRSSPRRNTSTPSNSNVPRDVKSKPYVDIRYEALLAAKGSFMGIAPLLPIQKSKRLCRVLLESTQKLPSHTAFRDEIFNMTIDNIRGRKESRVILDVGRLMVPSAEMLAIEGADHLRCLIENVNEGLNNSIPFEGPRPQPDYSVGFRSSAFSKEQLKKLQPLIGGFDFSSFFMATYQCYFPFFTCEIKCGAAALDIADRQNAHSMTLAVRGIVELFRCVKREAELNRKILAFSVSHDQNSVRIYGHYALISSETSYYRYPIRKFDYTERNGREKWTTYRFTKNVYDIWMPEYLKLVRSAIDELPDISFEPSQQADFESGSEPPLS